MISDGIHYQQAMLATQLNPLITQQQIVVRCIVRLNDYICNAVHGRKYVAGRASERTSAVKGGELGSLVHSRS